MINFKREYIALEKDRFLYPISFKDKSRCDVYGRKKFITESGEVQLSAHVFLISKDFWTFNAGQLDFTNYANGIWNDYISIVVVERGEYTAPSINFASMGDITPENLQGLSDYISKHLSDLEKRIVEDYLFIDEGVSENIELPNLPENHFWVRKNGVIVGVNIDYIKTDYKYFVKKLEKDFSHFYTETFEALKTALGKYYAEIYLKATQELKKLKETLLLEINDKVEHMIANIGDQQYRAILPANTLSFELPSTWVLSKRFKLYADGILMAPSETYTVSERNITFKKSWPYPVDIFLNDTLPPTFVEEELKKFYDNVDTATSNANIKIDDYVKTNAKPEIDKYVKQKEQTIKGATFTPTVSLGGDLSFTNDKNLPNPPVVNIVGPQGKPGVPGRDGEQGLPGKNGEDGKDLTVEVQGTIGMKFDESLRYLNDVGVKKKGFCYFDKLTNRAFECLNDTDLTVNDIRYFKDISNKHNIDYIAGLFENTKLYDINSNPINDNFFKGKVTKIIGVKIDVEANDFLNSENKLIKFNYKKVMNQCCYANIICTRPTKSHLSSSLENKVFARIQNIDSVEITIGVLNNNKKEKVEIFLVLYGD